ncbi:hypothetical protein N9L18_00460 [Candidatus Pacebacteria bacterium]|nr:hypothetical protein [Candidatus Paceibacterota bacterium]
MILVNKKVGETPLELLDRLREENSELKDKTLSYAGRLDPMAEGEMLVLVGEEENKSYKKYLGLDKEYIATFLIGMSTDAGDALGLILSSLKATKGKPGIDEDSIKNKVKEFLKIKKQTYPWFSSKTVDGIKLFDHYKSGNTDIKRPEREVKIYESELINFKEDNKLEDIKKYIFESINKVNEKQEGDFRKKEILDGWEEYFSNDCRPRVCGDLAGASQDPEINSGSLDVCDDLITFEVRLKVGSGTYIRALTEEFDFPVTLLKLKRTEIFI